MSKKSKKVPIKTIETPSTQPIKKVEWIPVSSNVHPTIQSYPIPEGAQIIAYCPKCKKIIFSEKYEINRSFLFGAGGLTTNYNPTYPIAHEVKCPVGKDNHYCLTLYTL